MAIEAVRLAFKYMSPVFYLSDGYLANGAEPWAIPEIESLPKIEVKLCDRSGDVHALRSRSPKHLRVRLRFPARRGLNIASAASRNSTSPATSITILRITISWSNCVRRKSIAQLHDMPLVEVMGEKTGKVLVLGWGSTYGSISSAVEKMQSEGKSVSSAHLRHLNPFPRNLGEVLAGFETVIIPEMNLGQLCTMIRAKYLVDAVAVLEGERTAIPDSRDHPEGGRVFVPQAAA